MEYCNSIVNCQKYTHRFKENSLLYSWCILNLNDKDKDLSVGFHLVNIYRFLRYILSNNLYILLSQGCLYDKENWPLCIYLLILCIQDNTQNIMKY